MLTKVFRFRFKYLRRFLKCIIFVILLSIVLYYKKISFIHNDGVLANFSQSGQHFVLQKRPNLSSSEVFNFIQLANKEEKIRNLDTFGPLSKDTIILVILLNKYSSGFKHVVLSLSQIRGIEEVLVIFSHSNLDANLNNIIKSIDFCRVMQIYYPYSIQTHLEEFPGYDPSDCPYDFNSKTSKVNCTGSLFRDMRGHFRNPPAAEKKHHWWWTANNIFENFSSTASHEGLVIFSEDNIIFMNDFIYMTSYMKDVADSLPQCEFLSLGSDITPTVPNIKQADLYSVELSSWNPKQHSRLLAFDMTVWDSIVSHYDLFCTLDDASWLRSLYFISVHRRDGKRYKTMSAVTPRAYKIDKCDFSFTFFGSRCDLVKNVLTIADIEKLNKDNWFPPYLELYIDVELEDENDVIFDYSEGNGGWADPRDWGLCRNMTAGKIKKILMEMRNEFNEYIGEK